MNQNSALGFRLYGTGYAKLPSVPPKPKTIQRKKNRQAVVSYYLLFNLRKNECIQLLALLSRGNFGTDLIKEYLVLDYYLEYLEQVRRLSIS